MSENMYNEIGDNKDSKRELKDVQLGPNKEDLEKKAAKIRQWVFANGIFEIKIKPKDVGK